MAQIVSFDVKDYSNHCHRKQFEQRLVLSLFELELFFHLGVLSGF